MYDIQVQGNYAYAAHYSSGLVVMDISNPSSPADVSHTYTGPMAKRICVSGNYAYVTHYSAGLSIVNISNPLAPVVVSTWAVEGNLYPGGIALANNYAFLAYDTALYILDVSTPSSPRQFSSCEMPGKAQCVAVSGNYAYVCNNNYALQVVDISTLTAPVIVSTFTAPNLCTNLDVSGNYAYIVDSLKYCLTMVDISNPAAITQDKISFPGVYYPKNVFVSGNYAYITRHTFGLTVLDISVPSNPQVRDSINGIGATYGIYVKDNYAYVTASAGLKIINVSNKDSLVKTGECSVYGTAKDVFVNGNYAYVCDYSSGLRVIDVTNPASPGEVGYYCNIAKAVKVHINGNYAYVLSETEGLYICDISTPVSPVVKGLYPKSSTVSFSFLNNYVFITTSYSGIEVVDVSSPENPNQAGYYTNMNSPKGIKVLGSKAYVTDYGTGLWILDFTPRSFISGYVRDSTGTVISGVTLNLSGDSSAATTTDNNGYFIFDGLSIGSYTVTPVQLNYSFNPVSASTNSLNYNLAGRDFIRTLNNYRISGTVRDISGSALIGATVTVYGTVEISTVTSADGTYQFFGLPGNTGYIINVMKEDYDFSDTISTNCLSADIENADFSGELLNYDLTGYSKDNSSQAIIGVTLSLSGTVIRMTTTTNSGFYQFRHLPIHGNYTVTPQKTDYSFSPASISTADFKGDLTEVNFFGTASYSISGYVSDSSGAGISGVQINISGDITASTTTSNSGYYEFRNLTPGSNYTVTPSGPDYCFAPSNRPYAALDTSRNAENYTRVAKQITDNGVNIQNEDGGSVNASAGGTVKVIDTASDIKNAQIEIPALALSTNTLITIGKVTNAPGMQSSLTLKGIVIDFRPVNGAVTFNLAVTIKLPYPETIENPYALKAYTYNTVTSQWEQLTIKSVDTANRLVLAETTHLSYYALAFSVETDLSKTKVYPNPYKPGSGHTRINFTGLTGQATIKIYNISGELISTLSTSDGQAVWHGKTDSGNVIASGIYIYLITNNKGEKKTGKLSIAK